MHSLALAWSKSSKFGKDATKKSIQIQTILNFSSRPPIKEAVGARDSRGPVTYASLALMTIVGGGLIAYYQYEKEKKVERVASEITTVGKPSLGVLHILVDQCCLLFYYTP